MVNYICKICQHQTAKKSDHDKHLLTKKHVENIKQEEINYKIEKMKLECDLKIAQTEIKCMREYETKIAQKDQQIAQKDQQIVQTLEIAKINSETARSSTSALSFIIKNYSNAPNIKTYDEFTFLKETNLYKLADKIVYKHKHKSLIEFLSKLLLEFYKKEKPDEQSIWNTDVSRLSYTVKNNNNKKKISKWIVDKKGSTLSSYAIKPILDKIKERIVEAEKYINDDINKEVEYRRRKIDEIEGPKYKSPIKYSLATKQEILLLCHEVKSNIENCEYEKDILIYIANHFYLTERE